MKVNELERAVAAGDIDTVLVCFVDMQGRLIGKTVVITSWLTTSRWSRCRVMQQPAGTGVMAIS